MKKFWRPRLLITLGAAILILILLRQFGPLKPTKAPTPRPTQVITEENILTASGTIQAHEVANLAFQTSGLLTWVGIKEGDQVKKWQGIASLDKREFEKKLARYLNLYLTNRWDFEQLQDDYKDEKERSLITDTIQRILDKAQFSLNNAVLDVELVDLAQQLGTISTPIEGIVTRVDTPNPGVNVTPATATFTIVNPTSIFFNANVDEADISKIKIGQEAKISLDAYQGEEFKGKVEKIAFVSTTTAGGGTAFKVEISLPASPAGGPANPDLKFKVGMNGDAEIILK